MALSWDISRIQNYHKACVEPDDNGRWQVVLPPEGWTPNAAQPRIAPKTMALILGSAQIGLPALDFANVEEWQYRLDALFDAGVYILQAESGEGLVPIRINRRDLELHYGLQTSAKSLATTAFDRYVRSLRLSRQIVGPSDLDDPDGDNVVGHLSDPDT